MIPPSTTSTCRSAPPPESEAFGPEGGPTDLAGVVTQWFTYAKGRTVEPDDACQVEDLQIGFENTGGDLSELLISIVKRPEFRLRSTPFRSLRMRLRGPRRSARRERALAVRTFEPSA